MRSCKLNEKVLAANRHHVADRENFPHRRGLDYQTLAANFPNLAIKQVVGSAGNWCSEPNGPLASILPPLRHLPHIPALWQPEHEDRGLGCAEAGALAPSSTEHVEALATPFHVATRRANSAHTQLQRVLSDSISTAEEVLYESDNAQGRHSLCLSSGRGGG